MGKKQVEEQAVKEVKETEEEKEPKVQAEVHIKVYDNGMFGLDVPDESQELKPEQIEMITKNVYEQLYETRIAQKALEMFKQRLG